MSIVISVEKPTEMSGAYVTIHGHQEPDEHDVQEILHAAVKVLGVRKSYGIAPHIPRKWRIVGDAFEEISIVNVHATK